MTWLLNHDWAREREPADVRHMQLAAAREALIEFMDTIICRPCLPSATLGVLLCLTGPTVLKYRMKIVAKLRQ